MNAALVSLLEKTRVVPVVTIERVEDAVPLARALVRGGLPVMEVTLRTDAALDAIHAVARHVPECLVGAGTLVSGRQVDAARSAGARFGVSPGFRSYVVARAVQLDFPLVCGVATPSEIMAALGEGLSLLKIFPVELLGGVSFVRAMAQVFPQARWFPTGGITEEGHGAYLRVPSVVCVGGSWMVTAPSIAQQAFGEIERRARVCAHITQRELSTHEGVR